MSDLEFQELNLTYALKLGLINWFQYFVLYTKLHEDKK